MAEAEYAAAFGGGQVLVELTLTLTNLQQSPPLSFVDNECAIGLGTSSVEEVQVNRHASRPAQGEGLLAILL